MTDVLVFHHALGVTAGIRAFADALREAGHTVGVPDLFDGVTFDTIAAGVAHAEEIGFDVLTDRGVLAAAGRSGPFAVVGFSLGVLPAQKLAQRDPDVVGAVLCHSAVPSEVFGPGWPARVELQIHMTEGDPWAEEDLPAARALAEEAGGELYLYPGSGHLVADPSGPDHDPEAAASILERTQAFLERIDPG